MHALRVAGVVAMGFGIRTVSPTRSTESGGNIPGYCGFAQCVDGPFDVSNTLSTLGVSLTRAVGDDQLSLTVGAGPVLIWQRETLTFSDSGASHRSSSVGGLGPQLDAELRLAPLVWKIRPMAHGGYTLIRGSECLADASCYGSRHVMRLGVGLSRTLR